MKLFMSAERTGKQAVSPEGAPHILSVTFRGTICNQAECEHKGTSFSNPLRLDPNFSAVYLYNPLYQCKTDTGTIRFCIDFLEKVKYFLVESRINTYSVIPDVKYILTIFFR